MLHRGEDQVKRQVCLCACGIDKKRNRKRQSKICCFWFGFRVCFDLLSALPPSVSCDDD